jgi:hypothetical protein
MQDTQNIKNLVESLPRDCGPVSMGRATMSLSRDSVVDQHHLDAEPDADPNSTYHPDADTDADFFYLYGSGCGSGFDFSP